MIIAAMSKPKSCIATLKGAKKYKCITVQTNTGILNSQNLAQNNIRKRIILCRTKRQPINDLRLLCLCVYRCCLSFIPQWV